MEMEQVKQIKHHFSRLGLMYFFGTLVIIGVQTAAIFIMQAAAPELLADNDLYLIATMLPMYLIAMPVAGLLIRTVPAEPVQKRSMPFGRWLVAFMMCYSIMYLSNIIGNMLTTLIGAVKGAPVNNAILQIASGISPWVSILIMVICAPIAEEFIFRKLLIDRCVRYGEGCSVILSGVMFGLFHGNLNQFAYAFTLGAFFGYIYVKTGKIIYTIAMHMVINFLGSVASLALLQFSGYEQMMSLADDPGALTAYVADHLPQLMVFILYFVFILGLTIAGIVLLIVNAKKFTTYPGEIILPKGHRFSILFLNVGMILFSAFWIIQIIIQLFR